MSGLFFALAVLLSFAVSAAPLDLKTPEGQIAALRRIQCSEVDGKPVTFYWKGVAYSRVPGEPDRLLFRVEGMNTRHCGPLANAKSKVDFRLVTREILLYEDPASGEVLKTWSNPWTGKTVEVVQVANDPVNGNYSVVGRDGKPVNLPFEVLGKQWWLSTPVPVQRWPRSRRPPCEVSWTSPNRCIGGCRPWRACPSECSTRLPRSSS